MWTRRELKERAKNCLRQYYWAAVLVCFLAGLLGASDGGSGSGVNAAAQIQNQQSMQESLNYFVTDDGEMILQEGQVLPEDADEILEFQMGDGGNPFLNLFAGIFAVVMLVAVAVVILLTVFVGNPVMVGKNRYFMESRQQMRSAGVRKIFYAFERGKYWNVVKTMFMRDLFIGLWSLLLVIPGIIKAYQYHLVPYILSENPDMEWREALDLSRSMMDGQKWDLFVLELSFIGWYLLGSLLCGIGVLFVNPYVEAALAELYAVLRSASGAVGLRGFDEEPYAAYDGYSQ